MRMLLVLALACAPFLYAQNDPVRLPAPKKGQEHIADGEEAFAEGRMQDAVDAFTKALAAQPENDEALAYRAAAFVALGKLDKADEDLATAVELNTDFSLAWNTRGYVKWLRADHAGAIEDYNAALAYAADDRRVDDAGMAQLHQNRGVAYQDLGDTDRALLDFDQCVELLPDNPAFLENRGLVYVDKGLFDMAFRDFDAALELDSKNARAYVNRAYAARLMDDFEQAVRDYSQALRLKNDYGQALIGRAYAWIGWDRPELAKKDFEAAQKVAGFEASARTGLGDVAMLKGEFQVALEHYDAVAKSGTWHPPALRGAVYALIELDKVIIGSGYTSPLCRREPHNAENWILDAKVQLHSKRWEEAVRSLNNAIEIAPQNLEARGLRIRCHLDKKQFKIALADAERTRLFDDAYGRVEVARVKAIRNNGESDIQSVLIHLRNATELGLDLRHLADDPDFAALKDNEEFKKLTNDD